MMGVCRVFRCVGVFSRTCVFKGHWIRGGVALGLASLMVSGVAQAAPDFASSKGFVTSCKTAPKQAKAARSAAQRQSFVICQDVAMLQRLITWASRAFESDAWDKDRDGLQREARRELTALRDTLASSRQVLVSLKLKPNEGVMVKPGTWQLDLDGDGKIQTWEQYFFAIPRRDSTTLHLGMPHDHAGYYQRNHQLQGKFRVDQSDVLWALAYHQFIEGMLELVLAHDLDTKASSRYWLKLRDPQGVQRAHRLIGEGFATSGAMRRSLLAETDDQDEWIPNPRQKNSVFPMALDEAAFATWGQFLDHMDALWQGKTLLAADAAAQGVMGDMAKMCPAGTGLNVAHLMQHPPTYPLAGLEVLATSCQPINAQRPVSGLAAMLNEALERGRANPNSPEWHFVRYLYWVN